MVTAVLPNTASREYHVWKGGCMCGGKGGGGGKRAHIVVEAGREREGGGEIRGASPH